MHHHCAFDVAVVERGDDQVKPALLGWGVTGIFDLEARSPSVNDRPYAGGDGNGFRRAVAGGAVADVEVVLANSEVGGATCVCGSKAPPGLIDGNNMALRV